jgi:hypothetical protein
VTNHGMKQLTNRLTGDTMAKYSKSYRTDDASRFPSSYINDLLPTKRCLATFDSRVDGRCFACNQLWEDTTHMLTCTCDARCEARKAARTILFQQKFMRMHTPDILTQMICNNMDNWLARRPVLPPALNGPEEPIQHQIHSVFKAQATIGWDQFFRGHIGAGPRHGANQLERTTYRIRQPGESFTPDQWMRTVSSRNFGCSQSPYGSNGTRNCMVLMVPSQWNNVGKKP